MESILPRESTRHWTPLRWSAVGAAALFLGSYFLVQAPFMVVGIVLGLALVWFAFDSPLAVVGLMLALGPIDLSFLTGGFKGLLEDLGGLDMNGIRLLGIVFALTLLILARRDLLRVAFSPHGRWYLLFMGFAVVSLLASLSLVHGLKFVLKLAYPLLFFVVVLGTVRSRADIEKLVDWTLVGAAFIVFFANPIYVLSGGGTIQHGDYVRVGGVGTHTNPFSFYLLIILLLSYSRFVVRGQVRYLILGAGAIAWMMLTLTRSTLMASMVGLAVMAIHSAVLARSYRGLIAAAAVGGGLAVLLVPLFLERTFFGHVPTAGELFSLVSDPVQLYYMVNLEGRQLLWGLLFASFLTSPWIGLGAGTSNAILLANFPEHWGAVPHSEYIRMLVELGLVGSALYALAIGKWTAAVLRASRTADPTVRVCAVPAFGAIIAWAFIALTDNAFDYYAPFTQYVGVLCAGAIAAARFAAADEADGVAAGADRE